MCIRDSITIVSMAFCFAMAYIAEEYFGIADITGAYIAGIVLCTMDDASYVAVSYTHLAKSLMSSWV